MLRPIFAAIVLLSLSCSGGPELPHDIPAAIAALEQQQAVVGHALADLKEWSQLVEAGDAGKTFFLMMTAADVKTYSIRTHLPAPIPASAFAPGATGAFQVENVVDVLFRHSNQVQLALFVRGVEGSTWPKLATPSGDASDMKQWDPTEGLRADVTATLSLAEDGTAIGMTVSCTRIKLFGGEAIEGQRVMASFDRYLAGLELRVPLTLGEGHFKPDLLSVTPNYLLVRFERP